MIYIIAACALVALPVALLLTWACGLSGRLLSRLLMRALGLPPDM